MRYCLVCRADVSQDGYNPNYYGVAIHHNYQDSYCGPVIICDASPTPQERSRLMRNYRARQRYDILRRQKVAVARQLLTEKMKVFSSPQGEQQS